MSQTAARFRNESVDTFRMIAAFCVIIIHVDLVYLPRFIIAAKVFCYWALPFFFITSGYFLAEKSARNKTLDVYPIVERLGWIFFIWILIYLPLKNATDHLGFLGILDMATTPIFFYNGDLYHLWYISAAAVGSLFIAAAYRYNAEFLLALLSALIIGMVALAAGYQMLGLDTAERYLIPMARYWRAIPLIYMGFLIHKWGIPSWRASIFLIIFGAVMLPLEIKFIGWYYGHAAYQELLLSSIPIGFGMASLGLNNLKIFRFPLLAKWGRDYSLGVYLLHPLVIYLTRYIPLRALSFLLKGAVWEALLPFVTLVLCLAILGTCRRFLPSVYNLLFGIRALPQQ